MVPAETLRAVRAKAELLNGGASLGEAGDALTEIAVQRAMACCRRRDVPEDMEQAVAALALALFWTVPRSAASGGGGDAPEDAGAEAPEAAPEDSRNASGASGNAPGGSPGGPAGNWEALIAAGAVKTIQRGDTSISFNTSAREALSSALAAASGADAARPTVEAALAGLAPWKRLGRLEREVERDA